MWKNSDEFLLLSVWMLYVISELMPEMRIQARKTDIQKGGNENGTLFYIDGICMGKKFM